MENLEPLNLAKIGTQGKGKSAFTGELSKAINKVVSKEIETREISMHTSKTVFDPSTITQCPRRLVYRHDSTESERIGSPYLEHMAKSKNITKWLDFLDKCAKIKVLDSYVLVADTVCNLTGWLDGVLEIELDNGYKHIVAIKTHEVVSNVFSCLFPPEGDSYVLKNDVIELNVSMWMAGLIKGILLYSDSKQGRYSISELDLNQTIIDRVEKKCSILNQYCLRGQLPSKPYLEISAECEACEFKTKCWAN